MLFDNHTHSRHSFDSSEELVNLCEAAVAQGLTGLAVTNHCDLGDFSLTENWPERLRACEVELQSLRERYRGRLLLRMGVELGQAIHDLPQAEQVLTLCPYDTVLASLHNIRNTEDFFYLQAEPRDRRAIISRYLDELLELTRWGRFCSLAHLTYPYRYLGYDDTPPIQDFEEQLRLLFTALAQSGKALEINTSGLYRRPPQHLMPQLWEVRLFRECGGELVSLGSDAHTAAHVGQGLQAGLAVLREAGFRYQAFFEQQIPALYPID